MAAAMQVLYFAAVDRCFAKVEPGIFHRRNFR